MAQSSSLKGFFITLEGGEGSGKSTLLFGLAAQLRSRGHEVLTTREPGGAPLGEEIREWLLAHRTTCKIGAKAELLLFLAARAQHIEECIEPALKSGKIVLCDRFNDSTIAYQGAARGLKAGYAQKLCELVCGPIVPQLTLFLDIDPRIGLLRAQKVSKEQAASGELDRIESETIQFHQAVWNAFKKIAKREPLRVYSIDANQSEQLVLSEALQAIDELLLLPAHRRLP